MTSRASKEPFSIITESAQKTLAEAHGRPGVVPKSGITGDRRSAGPKESSKEDRHCPWRHSADKCRACHEWAAICSSYDTKNKSSSTRVYSFSVDTSTVTSTCLWAAQTEILRSNDFRHLQCRVRPGFWATASPELRMVEENDEPLKLAPARRC